MIATYSGHDFARASRRHTSLSAITRSSWVGGRVMSLA